MAATVTPFGTPGTVPVVTITAGVPTAGSGTVSTLDNIFNSTNGPVDVKAASTAAVAGDKALVVAISPNGQNTNGRKVEASSAPVALSTEDLAAVQNLSTSSLSAMTLATTATRVDRISGVDRVQIVRPHCNLEDIVMGSGTATTTSLVTCLPAAAAGIKTYVTSIVLCNTSASAVTVAITGGISTITLPLPAGSGCVFNPPVPLRGTAAATAWQMQLSGPASTVTCSMVGFMSKV